MIFHSYVSLPAGKPQNWRLNHEICMPAGEKIWVVIFLPMGFEATKMGDLATRLIRLIDTIQEIRELIAVHRDLWWKIGETKPTKESCQIFPALQSPYFSCWSHRFWQKHPNCCEIRMIPWISSKNIPMTIPIFHFHIPLISKFISH